MRPAAAGLCVGNRNMDEQIINVRLIEFIDLADRGNIDFAKITYSCSAYEFVDQKVKVNFSDEFIRSYSFKEYYTNWKHAEFMPYYVLGILHKTYLMYEIDQENSEITTWVCYTEEEHRGKGYMRMLLNSLKNAHPGVRITVDTYNEALRNICNDLGIRLFR
ncbi:hypothetical protein YM18_2357 [Geobacter sulfurreducens]|nr:hypothetical protein YM18_2357 [Geobacter sulfurreducens]